MCVSTHRVATAVACPLFKKRPTSVFKEEKLFWLFDSTSCPHDSLSTSKTPCLQRVIRLCRSPVAVAMGLSQLIPCPAVHCCCHLCRCLHRPSHTTRKARPRADGNKSGLYDLSPNAVHKLRWSNCICSIWTTPVRGKTGRTWELNWCSTCQRERSCMQQTQVRILTLSNRTSAAAKKRRQQSMTDSSALSIKVLKVKISINLRPDPWPFVSHM
jgi:hypothetical protein